MPMRRFLPRDIAKIFHLKFWVCSSEEEEGSLNKETKSNGDSEVFPVLGSMDVSSHQRNCWANLPPEILRSVIMRVEMADGSWPSRKDVVACSAVCKTWRCITKELVKTPEESGKLTFPISLKQPGPRDKAMQCFIKRDKANSMFYLYLGLTPATLIVENSKFLLAARKYRRTSSIEYIISLNSDDISRDSNTYVGKLRSNFIGTKFKIYDTYPPDNDAVMSTSNGSFRCLGSKQVCPKAPFGNYKIAQVAYQLNVLGSRGPRQMVCTFHSIPLSSIEAGGHAPTPIEPYYSHNNNPSICDPYLGSLSKVDSKMKAKNHRGGAPLVLRNKSPRWHEQLQCWCLNFRGRVTVASVKNFQLVVAIEPGNIAIPQSEHDRVLLQFGKIGKDIFTMDYQYPLSAYQAFAICLTSFGTKLACE